MRPSWNDYFLKIAKVVSERSLDPSTKVGAVIVDENNRIVATGYNSLPQGVDDSFWPLTRESEERQTSDSKFLVNKYNVITHAEANAIASSGCSLRNCTLYCTLFPCNECAKLIITAGIKKVVYASIRDDDSHKISTELMRQAKIELLQVEEKKKMQEEMLQMIEDMGFCVSDLADLQLAQTEEILREQASKRGW